MTKHNILDYENDFEMTKEKDEFMKLRHDKKIKYDNLKTLRKDLEFVNVQKLKNF